MSEHDDQRRPLLADEPISTPHSASSTTLYAASDDPENTSISSQTSSKDPLKSDTVPETATIGRNLTWTSAYMLTISRIIGSGIFATPGNIYQAVGSIGLVLIVWLAGSAMAFCGLAISLELGCMLPRSGGDKVYLEYIYRRPRFLASTIVAMQAVLLGFSASNSLVFAEYILFALKQENTVFAQRAIAVGLMTVITIIHGCFLRTGIWIQNFLGWVKIGVMAFMLVLGVVAVSRPQPSQNPSPSLSWSGLFSGSNWEIVNLSTAIFKVSYSFAGYANVNNVLNEVRNPIFTLKTMAPAALLTVTVFYLMINLAYFAVVPLAEIKSSGQLIAALFFEKLFGKGVTSTLLPVLIAISAAGNVMVVTFSLARINQEVARQGFLPFADYLASSRPFNAPLGGLIVHYIPTVLVIVLPPQKDVYDFILNVEGYPGQFFALALAGGLLWLRRSKPELKRPFRAWLVPIYLRVLLSICLIAAPFFPPKNGRGGESKVWYGTYAVVGGGLLVCAVLYWYVWLVLLPRRRGYRVEEKTDVLEDGTSVVRLVRVKAD